MNALILHPTEAYAKPVTICPPKRAKAVKKPRREPTKDDLIAMCKARGLKTTTKHTKGELLAMFAAGVYIRPAAYDRDAARRATKAG